ncbi:LKH1 [Candida oxycetoniae]|uniref:LKH1 n=1 Tax=Candida oxycetoniae TaxID=497107 RepID=A0AAI9SZX9_9ASCO|nr:LKH1 [Candida oxycetoniae]KAI3406049.2 LKH1 [Candida oxycetoniae]
MSLLTNRKRPRGYSENFVNSDSSSINHHAYQQSLQQVQPQPPQAQQSQLQQSPQLQQQQQQQQSQQQLQSSSSSQQQDLFLHHHPHQLQSSSSSSSLRQFTSQSTNASMYQGSYHQKSSFFHPFQDSSNSNSSSTIIEDSHNSLYLGSVHNIGSTQIQPKKSKFTNPFLSVEENDVILDDDDDEADTFVLEDEERDNYDEDDDVIIFEEKDIIPRSKRNNSDSILVNRDAAAAYKLFNVNKIEIDENKSSGFAKKQRTSSLPQLPQVKCFYNKLPNNYILQTPKLGNIKTDIIPHQNNLPPCDDENGHYIIKPNEPFANRFIIIKLLGQGTFGKVVKCYDKVNREHVAIKIIRNIQKYRDAAKIELRILSTLKKFDNANKNHCIHLRECFDYRGHICIVTDLLKISLYDFLENNKFIPFPGSHIQAISKQLIRSVTFLHDLNLIHTDLKPENILLHDDSYAKKTLYSSTISTAYTKINNSSGSSMKKVPKTSKVLKNPLIQVIDFGSAIFNDEYHSSIVSTRHYRAPEIVLGTGWSYPCDMWSIGCILVELIIGEPLFKTHDNLEHLAMIEKICGYRIDKSMVKLSKLKENECGLEYFTNEYIYDTCKYKRRGGGYEKTSITTSCTSSSDNDGEQEQEEGGEEEENEEGEEDEDENDSFDDDVIFDDERTLANSLILRFPTISTPQKFVNSVNELKRIDLFISYRIGLHIDFDFSLNQNFEKNKHLINFGNFTFWWFFIDLLKQLFIINPENRITALEALNHPWFNLGIQDEGTT